MKKIVFLILVCYANLSSAEFETQQLVLDWQSKLWQEESSTLFIPLKLERSYNLTTTKNFAIELANLYASNHIANIRVDSFSQGVHINYPLGFNIELQVPGPVKNVKASFKNCFYEFLLGLSDVQHVRLLTVIKENLYKGDISILESFYRQGESFSKRFYAYRNNLQQTDFKACYAKQAPTMGSEFVSRYFDLLGFSETDTVWVEPKQYGTLSLLVEPMYRKFRVKYLTQIDSKDTQLQKALTAWKEELAINAVPLNWDIPIDSAISKTKSIVSKLSFANLESFNSLVGFIFVESLLGDMKQSYPVIQQSLNDRNWNEDIIGVLLSIDRIVTICKPYFMTKQICPSNVFRKLNWVIFNTGKNNYKILLPKRRH